MEYTKIENMDIPDKEKKDLKSKVKLSIYILEKLAGVRSNGGGNI